MRILLLTLSCLGTASCATSDPVETLAVKRISANAMICRKLSGESSHVLRIAKPTDTTLVNPQNYPTGFVPITYSERQAAKKQYAEICEPRSEALKKQEMAFAINHEQ